MDRKPDSAVYRYRAARRRRARLSDGEARELAAAAPYLDRALHDYTDWAGREILALGEPSYDRVRKYLAPFFLDKAMVGAPNAFPPTLIDWDGSIRLSCGRDAWDTPAKLYAGFSLGARGEEGFGRDRRHASPFRLKQGYLPIGNTSYRHAGVRYRLDHVACDSANAVLNSVLVRVTLTLEAGAARTVRFWIDVVQDSDIRSPISVEGPYVKAGWRHLLMTAVPLKHVGRKGGADRFVIRRTVAPGKPAAFVLRFFHKPGDLLSTGEPGSETLTAHRSRPEFVAPSDFSRVQRGMERRWQEWLKGFSLPVLPEERLNACVRNLLVQNALMSDGDLQYYGAETSAYGHSNFCIENFDTALCNAFYGGLDVAGRQLRRLTHLHWVARAGDKHNYPISRGTIAHYLHQYWLLSGDPSFARDHVDMIAEKSAEIRRERQTTLGLAERGRRLHAGLLPRGIYGGDIWKSHGLVYSLVENIAGWNALRVAGLMLKDTGRGAAARDWLADAGAYRRQLMDILSRQAMKRADGTPFTPFIVYPDEWPEMSRPPESPLSMLAIYHSLFSGILLALDFFRVEDPVARGIVDNLARHSMMLAGILRYGPNLLKVNPIGVLGYGSPDAASVEAMGQLYLEGFGLHLLEQDRIDELLLVVYATLAHGMTRYTQIAQECAQLPPDHAGRVDNELSPLAGANAMFLHLLRKMLVLERRELGEKTGTLDLLWGIPRAWLRPGSEIHLPGMPSMYGRIHLDVAAAKDAISCRFRWAGAPRDGLRKLRLRLRTPGRRAISRVVVNGSAWRKVDSQTEAVLLPVDKDSVEVTVSY